jgi:hypothetical protein
MGLDRLVDLGQRVARRMPRPGKVSVRVEDGDMRLWPGSGLDDLGKARAPLSLVADQEGGQFRRPRHRRRQANRRKVGR